MRATSARLRQAVAADIAAIQIVRHAVRENAIRPGIIQDQDVRREIEETGRGWVVEQDDELVAFAIGNAVTGNVWALFVAPQAQGRGHGDRLHRTMVAWLWSRGLERLWLTTGRLTPALGFYERRGWSQAGTAPHDQVELELRRPTVAHA